MTQKNTETGEGILFMEYINTFSKLKAEASGYPAGSIVPKTRADIWTRFGRVK